MGEEVWSEAVIPLEGALLQAQVDLTQLNLRWAFIGGIAVSVRGEPRTTRDLDLAVAVASDQEAEGVVGRLLARGYRFEQTPLEQIDLGRIATVRLVTTRAEIRGVVVDLMFASSGIEEEIAAGAETLEVLPGVVAPVATTGHLLALKTLAGRSKDVTDFATLVQHAKPRDIQEAREALELIARRGYDRGKNLQIEFAKLLAGAPGEI